MLICIVQCSCQFDPHANRYIHKPPNESDLVGIWKSSDGTEVIELKADHTVRRCVAAGHGLGLCDEFVAGRVRCDDDLDARD